MSRELEHLCMRRQGKLGTVKFCLLMAVLRILKNEVGKKTTLHETLIMRQFT